MLWHARGVQTVRAPRGWEFDWDSLDRGKHATKSTVLDGSAGTSHSYTLVNPTSMIALSVEARVNQTLRALSSEAQRSCSRSRPVVWLACSM